MNLSNRLEKLEKATGLNDNYGVAFLMVREGETTEQAFERLCSENPAARNATCIFSIIGLYDRHGRRKGPNNG